MSVGPGTTLLHYRLVEKIGEGGMGQVWRATDTTLGRDVAIKVIPAEFATDRDRILRFEREAQVLASLSHPGIASIHGLHESGDVRFLVMELVPGEDLSARLAGGAIPLGDALSIAKQIAEALEAAHEQGVIHRDLKPANIKITPDGSAKLLDFGLAKAMDPMSSGSSTSRVLESPTLTARATMQGMILGTAAYMAPEQAAGATTDRRSDIWAFGVVLYEMLTGRRLFVGESISHVLAAVLKDDPDFAAVPPAVPPRIVSLLKSCLRKKPRQRLQAIGDARVVLEEVLAGDGDAAVPAGVPDATRGLGRPQLAAGMIGALLLGAVGASALVKRNPPAAASPRTLSELSMRKGLLSWSPALSPDGSKLALIVRDVGEGSPRIWVRTLATGDLRPVSGTGGARGPFWSPDGRSIGYFADRQLLRADLEGGDPIRLVQTENFCGASWVGDTILYCGGRPAGIHRIPSSGGEPVTLITPPAKEFVYLPQLLEGGRSFLYSTSKGEGEDEPRLRFATLDGATNHELLPTDSKALASGGRLFYLRGTTLLSRPFDVSAGRFGAGESAIVVEGVATGGGGEFTIESGVLVFSAQGPARGSRITIYGRDGKAVDAIDSETFLDDLYLSPDGKRAIVMKAAAAGGASTGGDDVWTIDLARKLFSRASFGERDDDPVFSPDGDAIVFAHEGNLYRKSLLTSAEPQILVESDADAVTNDWTKDGTILYSDMDGAGEDLLAVPVSGGTPRRLTKTPFREFSAQVSPDGRWIAFVSTEAGDPQIYLARWPSFEGRWRVSKESAAMPRWRGDGRELYFLSSESRLMHASVSSTASEPVISLPEELFLTRHQGSYSARNSRWAVTPDGQRFLVIESPPGQEDDTSPMMLVTQPFASAGTP